MTPGFSWENGLHGRVQGAWPSGSASASVQEDPANVLFVSYRFGG